MGLPIEQACERIARLGFEAIDVWSAHQGCPHLDDVAKRLGPEGLKEVLAKNKLKLFAFSVYRGGYEKYAELLGKTGGGVAVRGSTRPCKPEELTAKMRQFLEGLIEALGRLPTGQTRPAGPHDQPNDHHRLRQASHVFLLRREQIGFDLVGIARSLRPVFRHRLPRPRSGIPFSNAPRTGRFRFLLGRWRAETEGVRRQERGRPEKPPCACPGPRAGGSIWGET